LNRILLFLLLASFYQSGILVPLIPGGIRVYNLGLEMEEPVILYLLLDILKALLTGDGPEINVISEQLNWKQMNQLLGHQDPSIVMQCLVCFSNLAMWGEVHCRRLVDCGLLDSLIQILDSAVFQLKVEAVDYSCPFLKLNDLCEGMLLESKFLDLFVEMAAGMSDSSLACAIPWVREAMERVVVVGNWRS
jgi:hypothetical protein